MNNDLKTIEINQAIQLDLNTLNISFLQEEVATHLHQIWRDTRLIGHDDNGVPIYEDRWKQLDPNESEEEKKFVEMFLSHPLKPNNKVKVENGVVSINISQMGYKELSPHWQQENKDAAIVAVDFALDNYIYLKTDKYKEVGIEMLGSAIHALWLSRDANSYARTTELGKRFGLLPREEQLKDNRHILIARNAIDYMINDHTISSLIEKAIEKSSKDTRVSTYDITQINVELQHPLESLKIYELIEYVATELHQIWRNTRIIGKDDLGNPIYQDRWKELNPNESEEEKKFVEMFLAHQLKPNNKVKVENGVLSINISQMGYKELSPHWQQENKDAATVAVNFALDNYGYLLDSEYRNVCIEMLGSAIHALWLSRDANSYARTTELGKRFGLLPREEQLKDNRHIIISEKVISNLVKLYNLNNIINISKKINQTTKR